MWSWDLKTCMKMELYIKSKVYFKINVFAVWNQKMYWLTPMVTVCSLTLDCLKFRTKNSNKISYSKQRNYQKCRSLTLGHLSISLQNTLSLNNTPSLVTGGPWEASYTSFIQAILPFSQSIRNVWSQELSVRNPKSLYVDVLTLDAEPDYKGLSDDPTVKDLIQKLLIKDPVDRLKIVNGIRDHKFFEAINWRDLQERKIKAPILIDSTQFIGESQMTDGKIQ